jgi:hypothetical protein
MHAQHELVAIQGCPEKKKSLKGVYIIKIWGIFVQNSENSGGAYLSITT